jgi:putative sigma-54 modulation protein
VNVNILDRNVGITSSQQEHIERCIDFAFDRFSSLIRTVDVSFSDMNGPKGGEDLQCRMKIVLEGKGDLVVEGKGVSVESVVAETADRAALAVSRRLDRLSDRQGTSMSGQ